MVRAGPGAPGAAIQPGPEADYTWLYQVALCGLLDQLKDIRGRRLHRYEVGEVVLNRTVNQMTNLFRIGSDAIGPDELVEIEERLHAWAAENYDCAAPPNDRCAPDDPRHYLLSSLYARLSQRPRAVPLRIPASWFDDLAAALVSDGRDRPSVLQVIAAGHALASSMELLDRIPKDPRLVELAPLWARVKAFDRLDNALPGAHSRTDVGPATRTVALLLEAGRLPTALFGDEAMTIAARLRLPVVLQRTEDQIRADGIGSRLWRVFSFMIQAERELHAALSSFDADERLAHLAASSAIHALDGHLLSLLNDEPRPDAYPVALGEPVEVIQQRLQFHNEMVRTISGPAAQVHRDIVAAFPSSEETLHRCAETLRGRIATPTIIERERAFAVHVYLNEARSALASLGEPLAKISPSQLRVNRNGILARALTDSYEAYAGGPDSEREQHPLHDLYQEAEQRPSTAEPIGDGVAIDLRNRAADETSRRVRAFVSTTIANTEIGTFIPDALLSGPRGSTRNGTRHEVPSALEELLVILVTSYDAVARRRCADALRSGMLSGIAAPILAGLLVDEIDGWNVPLSVRGLAVFALLLLSPLADPSVVHRLARYAYRGETMADDDPEVELVREATWALGDLVLHKVAYDPGHHNDPESSLLFAEVGDALYRASWSPSGRIRRPATYGLLALEHLDLHPPERDTSSDEGDKFQTNHSMIVERLGHSITVADQAEAGGVSHPLSRDTDPTVLALLTHRPGSVELLTNRTP